ncbi:DUF6884 domain-containing protein [Halopiger xanaduensis]|uniref:DUF6884 domain-containing protein n=1 Tax=Halopiger xanaduensis TaxID=387343 RepID=UPI00315DC456
MFSKSKRYCEQHHDDWYVLSAKHHLLEPDGSPIEPYDEMLTGARIRENRAWATATRNCCHFPMRLQFLYSSQSRI